MKNKLSIRGFTLIEVVTVIALLGFLSLVALSFSSSALWRGRNSRRISDMEQIRNALEVYRADNSTLGYPDPAVPLTTSLVPDYMNSIPAGPQNLGYAYSRTAPFEYCLCSPMEGTAGTDFPVSECTDIPVGFIPADYEPYCVAN